MPRRPSEYIELDGPLFDPGMVRKFNRAVEEGIEELADEGIGIMAAAISAGGFVRTGELLRSVEAKLKPGGGEMIGYDKIAPTAVWPLPDRPTRTWIQRGMRRGVKLRRGYDIFARTATGIKNLDHNRVVAKHIEEALN